MTLVFKLRIMLHCFKEKAMKPLFLIGACWGLALTSLPGITGENTKQVIEKKSIQEEIVILAVLPEASVAGNGVSLKIRVENQSKKPVSFTYRSKYWDYDLRVLDWKGQPVPLTRFGKRAYADSRKEVAGEKLRLAAGKHVEVTLNVARVFDLTKTGEYTVTISRETADEPKGEKTTNLRIDNLRFKVVSEQERIQDRFPKGVFEKLFPK